MVFYTLGCKVNYSETQALADRFHSAGFDVLGLDGEEGGDVYVLNSCTVTAESDRKTRKAFAHFKKQNPNALMVLTGCMTQANPESADNMGADIITGTLNRAALPELVKRRLAQQAPIKEIPAHVRGEAFERLSAATSERTRAFLKIQDGCDRYCSYCIIPFARGPLRSMSPEEIEENTQKAVAAGHREIVLAGINLASYGRESGRNIADAVERAAKGGAQRIRLGSVEPDLMTDEVLRRLAAIPSFCPQFHLSLQSGSDTVLRRMGRHYDTALYADTASHIHAFFDNPSLTTDVMVGFPGETEEEFAQNLAFCERMGFLRLHVFSYSPRDGTKAAKMPDQIPATVKKWRYGQMAQLGGRLALRFYEGQQGKIAEVLAESENGEYFEGYSANYTPVRIIRSDSIQRGSILRVRLNGYDGNGCIGQIINNGND